MARIDASLRVFVVEFEEHLGKSFTYYQKNVTMFNVANNLVREAVTLDEGTSRVVAFGMQAFLYLVNKKRYWMYQKEVL